MQVSNYKFVSLFPLSDLQIAQVSAFHLMLKNLDEGFMPCLGQQTKDKVCSRVIMPPHIPPV